MNTRANLVADMLLGSGQYRSGDRFYAILDTARNDKILKRLESSDEARECLFDSNAPPALRKVAPYLVELEAGSELANWVAENGVGDYWGVFFGSSAEMSLLKNHFRRFLKAVTPEGEILYFRFYDPRVLGRFLSTCRTDELISFFGPVDAIVLEGAELSVLVQYSVKDGRLQERQRGWLASADSQAAG